MIKRNDFKSIMLKHFKGVLTPEIIDFSNDLTCLPQIRNEDYLPTGKEILLNVYACFLYKELDFTFTMGVINNNLQRIIIIVAVTITIGFRFLLLNFNVSINLCNNFLL